ncbi:AAA family ATPase [Brevibacillus laterosporus]|uniref:AAA family ATPase n=1 Tax=Brevibacillus laterosporus TaxID=1465 RepID=UPI003D24F789
MYLRKLKVLEEGLPTEEYPFDIPRFRNLKHIDFNSNVTFFMGENGTGKSTLLEAIAYQITKYFLTNKDMFLKPQANS